MKTTADLLSHNLASLREERGLTQERLAELAGVSLDTVQRAELKIRFPRVANLTAIAAALGVPESRLFRDPEGNPPPTPKEALAVLAEVAGVPIEFPKLKGLPEYSERDELVRLFRVLSANDKEGFLDDLRLAAAKALNGRKPNASEA